jgi:hypothetical protein
MTRTTKKQQFEKFHDTFKTVQQKGFANVTKSDFTLKEKVIPRYPSREVEADVLKSTRFLLTAKHLIVLRRQSGLFFTQYGEMVTIGEKGESDLEILADNGKHVFLELKSGHGGWLSEDQIKFRNKVQRLGHVYLTACSALEAKEKVFEALGIKDNELF